MRLAASSFAQRNDVRSGDESSGHFRLGAGCNNEIVIVAGTQSTEHRGRLLRLDQRQVTQKSKYVFGWLQSRRNERDFNIFVMKMPSERGCKAHASLIYLRRQDSGCGIVEDDTEFAFIFAAELAHFESASAGRGLPVDMAGGIIGHVVADEVKIVAAATHKGFEFAGDHRENFEELVGRFDNGKDDHFASQVDAPRLHQERKRKARSQTKVFFAVTAAGGEFYLKIGAEFLSGSEERKINGFLQDGFFCLLAHTTQAAIGQAEPLVLGRTIARQAERVSLPLPPVSYFAFGRDDTHGK